MKADGTAITTAMMAAIVVRSSVIGVRSMMSCETGTLIVIDVPNCPVARPRM